MSLQELIPILQIAIGPVILISGVGLLLLSMTNRFARVIDRARTLARELRNAPEDPATESAQLRILLKRAHIMRAGIALFIVSVLFTAVLIIVLFITAILRLSLAGAITGLFIAAMLSLIGALILFIVDINLSLTALKLELGGGEGAS
jgi:Protein of unknown function (DUF2721)